MTLKTASAFLLALGLTTQYPAIAREKSVTLRKECTDSRCVYYEGSRRVFSVEQERDTRRQVVRDGRGNPRAKITENEDGTVEVERTYPRR